MEEEKKVKRVRFVGDSDDMLRDLPQEVRQEIGFALYHAQIGEQHPSARRMSGNLRTVTEIRINDAAGTYRTMYTVEMKEAVYVLDVFQKKSKSGKATPKADLDRVLERLKRARAHYKEHGPPKS